MGLGFIFSRNWMVEILIDANFLSWACLFAYFVSEKSGFLVAFFISWIVALGLAAWIKNKQLKREKALREQ